MIAMLLEVIWCGSFRPVCVELGSSGLVEGVKDSRRGLDEIMYETGRHFLRQIVAKRPF